MQFPDALADPARVMRDLQARYFLNLSFKIESAQRDAELRRMEAVNRVASGRGAMLDAVYLFAAFLTLMFLYLIVALERHHRAIARKLTPEGAEPGLAS
jgi:hypothetical protein